MEDVMKNGKDGIVLFIFLVFAILGLLGLVGCGNFENDGESTHSSHKAPTSYENLATFEDQEAFQSYLNELSAAHNQQNNSGQESADDSVFPAADSAGEAQDSIDYSDNDSITNNQETGVDEGDIVKSFKNYLVILRRGRLFSVRLGDDNASGLETVSIVNAYPEGSRLGTWYDEMLIYDRTIVVVGYSYRVGATEIALFDIDDNGIIAHRETRFLRSNDYYSSRNYASRLIDSKLIFYMPFYLFLHSSGQQVTCDLPAIMSYTPEEDDDWSEIITATDIYHPIESTLYPVLHTVIECDLQAPQLTCSAQAVIGSYARTFYVAPDAVYLWIASEYSDFDSSNADQEDTADENNAIVYRIPLSDEDENARPGVVRAKGSPIDQFSFKQSDDHHLNILVRQMGYGDAMWNPEVNYGELSLIRFELDRFGENPEALEEAAYTSLSDPGGYTIQNRFVGDYLLFGRGSAWWYENNEDRQHSVFVVNYKNAESQTEILLNHSVDRIDAMGRSAIVVGRDENNLIFSALALEETPELMDSYVREGAVQGESRSHGYFYKAMDENTGILGLPIRSQGQGYEHLWEESVEVLFLQAHMDETFQFIELGSLVNRITGQIDDNCVVSCVDWYGNSRPIFYQDRIFALMGYELIEGSLDDQALSEYDRIHFLSDLGSR